MSAAPIAVSSTARRSNLWARLRSGDDIAYLITLLAAVSVIVITGLLVYELWINSAQARHTFGWGFLTSDEWDPVANKLGAAAYIYGTVMSLTGRARDRRPARRRRGDFSGGAGAGSHLLRAHLSD